MGKVYVGQTKLKIVLDLNSNITGTTVILKYEKPDGATGNFPMVITDAINGIVERVVALATDFDVKGNWNMWAHVTYADSKVAAGEPFKLFFGTEGEYS